MQLEKIFKTKTGYCHVLPSKIVFTRDGVLGNLAEKTTGTNIARLLALYGLMAAFLLYQAYERYQAQHSFQATLFGLASGYLLLGIVRSRNNSLVQSIARDRISGVKFKKATALSRAYFEVYFQEDDDKPRKRLILLPGTLTEGQEAAGRALKIFQEENLLS